MLSRIRQPPHQWVARLAYSRPWGTSIPQERMRMRESASTSALIGTHAPFSASSPYRPPTPAAPYPGVCAGLLCGLTPDGEESPFREIAKLGLGLLEQVFLDMSSPIGACLHQ